MSDYLRRLAALGGNREAMVHPVLMPVFSGRSFKRSSIPELDEDPKRDDAASVGDPLASPHPDALSHAVPRSREDESFERDETSTSHSLAEPMNPAAFPETKVAVREPSSVPGGRSQSQESVAKSALSDGPPPPMQPLNDSEKSHPGYQKRPPTPETGAPGSLLSRFEPLLPPRSSVLTVDGSKRPDTPSAHSDRPAAEKRPPAHRKTSAQSETNTVEIHIGRIEVSAVPPAVTPVRAPLASNRKSPNLSEYLNRSGRNR